MEKQYLILVNYLINNNYMDTITKFVFGEEEAIKQALDFKDRYSNTYCQVEVFEIEKIRTYTSNLESIK